MLHWRDSQDSGDDSEASTDEALLHEAIRCGNVLAVELLLQEGVDMYSSDSRGLSPMHIAIQMGNHRIINTLVDHNYDLNHRFDEGNTLLHFAVTNGTFPAIMMLLESGVDVDAVNARDETPLTKAVKCNKSLVVKFLLANGANLLRKAKRGQTYLHVAIDYASVEALRTLLQHNYPADTEDDSRTTPLRMAVERNDTASMSVLKTFGADIRQQLGSFSLLHEAAYSGCVKSIQWLVEEGLSVDITDAFDWTPLFYAAREGQLLATQALLDLKATANFRDKWGYTPAYYADERGFTEVVDLLSSRGGVL